MGKVVSIKDRKPVEGNPEEPEPNADLIEVLKSALEKAESGELQAFCAVGFLNDGSLYTIGSSSDSNYEMLGAIEWLRQDFFMRNFTTDDE